MGTRVRCKGTVKHIFEHYIIFEQKWRPGSRNHEMPSIKFAYPSIVNENDAIIQRAKHFAFPVEEKIASIENFSFVLTNGDGEWTFGYCRQQPGEASQECLMILSSIPYWNTIFYKILNYCVWISNWKDVHETFVENLYQSSVVESAIRNGAISVKSCKESLPPFISTCPNTNQLPSTLDNRCLAEFYNSLSVDSMITLFASLLSERRIFITSSKLSRLTSIVMACNILLYPMCWQHVLIPVLPTALSDYLETPFPIIVGVPLQTWIKGIVVNRPALTDIIHVNADTDMISTPYPEDLLELPNDIIIFLKSNLKNVEQLGEDGLAKVFLQALVKLFGHVESALAIDKNQLKLDTENFLQLAKSSHRKFLKTRILQAQMFQQLVDELISKIKSGESRADDIFSKEIESALSSGKVGFGKKCPTLNRTKLLPSKPHNKSSIHLSGAVSATNISNPIPQVPDFIRFDDDLAGHSATTLPRMKSEIPHNNFISTVRVESQASNSSSKDYSRQTMNPTWSNSWKHVVNDFQSRKTWSPNSDALNNNIAPPNKHQTFVTTNCSVREQLPSPLKPPASPFRKPTRTMHPMRSTTNNGSMHKETTEDLINFDPISPINPLLSPNISNHKQGTSAFQANVKEYEDLLKEYGLYEYFTPTTTATA